MRLATLFLIGLLAGCADDGAPRYRLEGAATFDGKPIAFGEIVLTPDGAAGNSGPQGIAPIRDGRYDTGSSHGFAGGPTVIRITGFDREGGKVICSDEQRVDLPRTGGTHDIDVPRRAAPAAKGREF